LITGVIVNFTTRTVLGFTYPDATLPVTISEFDYVHMLFGGFSGNWITQGSIDRVTGDTAATTTRSTTEYALKCRPAQRMF
jgi:hypothetical protein